MNKTILSASALALVILAMSAIAIPVFAAPTLNPNKLYGAPSYVLNLIGKKDGWSGGGTYDNPDRHTMFLPQTTADDLTVWMSQGPEFAVIDGNAFDDGSLSLQLGAGKYAVFIVALGKPGNGANIEGWIYNATDNTYLLLVGTINVQGHSKTPRWENATDLFWVSPSEDQTLGLNALGITEETWVFDYMQGLSTAYVGTNYLYLWQLDNNNNKLLQVRFYQIG
jgi:hypothetical protein